MAVADAVAPLRSGPRRVLAVACGAHALHDGYTDLIYVLLPIWQTEFALSFAALGVLRMLYTGAMASLQMPASVLARRWGGAFVLALGTLLAACAYLTIGLGGTGLALLAMALVLGGAGSATQHPLASALVSRAFDHHGGRAALGTYNFSGDLGKMAIPAAVAWMLVVLPWRPAVGIVGALGIAVGLAILWLLPRDLGSARYVATRTRPTVTAAPRSGIAFPLLLTIGVVDSSTRMGFLAFLPFVLKGKGAGFETIGLALTLIFAGGALGKLVCGLLGARLGVLFTVILTEGATALGIMAMHWLPLVPSLACLPLIGLALNGTSSVLYGTVPELVATEQQERAFGLFYTGTIGAGALAPVLYGLVGDAMGPANAIIVVAAVCLGTIPLGVALNPSLHPSARRAA